MLTASSRLLLRLSLTLTVGLLLPAAASAHRFGGPNDPCERKVGTSLIHITLYQPELDPDAEYCDNIPRAGNTVLVVDVLGDEQRRVPMALRVVENRGNESPRTVLSIPPKVYRRGVADAQMTLDAGGRYVTQILLGDGSAPQILSFPIRVAPWYRPLMIPALAVLALVALIAISMIRYFVTTARDASIPGATVSELPRAPILVRRTHREARDVTARSLLIALALAYCAVSIAACNRVTRQHTASLPDIHVIDSHGNPLSLGSLKGKVVLLDFIHVGCPGVCSNLVNKFGQVADSLGPELGSRVILLSITNDPTHDNAGELLNLARSSQADMKGWLFVTGKLDDVNRVIKAFGLDNHRLADGSPNHITQVFLLSRSGLEQHEYQGMVMNTDEVVTQIRSTLEGEGAS
jgi:cytochrome oxidase Cu insertion factor (SCO1/SenC/PrrC family)